MQTQLKRTSTQNKNVFNEVILYQHRVTTNEISLEFRIDLPPFPRLIFGTCTPKIAQILF